MNDLEVKSVNLMGDTIMAAKDKEGSIWVGVRWICKGLGMSEGQWKRQITNIQKDVLFQRGGSNLVPLPTDNGIKDVFCIRNDFVPLWLAKISITEKTRKEHPELANKLIEYQLKAKDILAEAFMQKTYDMPKTRDEAIALIAQGHVELRQEVDEIKADLESLKMDLPLLPIEADKITEAVKKKGVSVLGGKQSNAYNNRSLKQKVYNSIYSNLKYNFGVRSYKSIKRSQCDSAIQIINEYKPPYFLEQQIANENAQQKLEL